VRGFNLHKCISCLEEFSTPRVQSIGTTFKAFKFIQCPTCNKVVNLNQLPILGYLPPYPDVPLKELGFDLSGDTLDEKLADLKKQTREYHIRNGVDINFPKEGVFLKDLD